MSQIKISETPGGDAFDVAGRGELQMGVLIENMRREVLNYQFLDHKYLLKKTKWEKSWSLLKKSLLMLTMSILERLSKK